MLVTKAIFPVAGLGTRFLPATKAQPKEMLPLVDKPIIQYAVEEAVSAGLETLIIVTGRGKNAIEDHFDVSFELERTLQDRGKEDLLSLVRAVSDMVHIAYVRQKEALGLGHGLDGLLEVPGGRVINYEPSVTLALDDQRAFCKYLCPSSAILRWTSRPALLRVLHPQGPTPG